jgi:hypothetical protein
MINLRTSVCAVAIVFIVVKPGFAIPPSSGMVTKADQIIEDVKHYRPGVWDYEYNPCSGYQYRPPTKWEQKGFCPPGQAKKGNC